MGSASPRRLGLSPQASSVPSCHLSGVLPIASERGSRITIARIPTHLEVARRFANAPGCPPGFAKPEPDGCGMETNVVSTYEWTLEAIRRATRKLFYVVSTYEDDQ